MNLQLLKSSGVGFILILAGFLLAYQFVEPAPPKSIVLSTGSPTGAYHKFGMQLRDALAVHGIDLQLRNSAGSGENASLLAADEVDFALIQGGTKLDGIPIASSSAVWPVCTTNRYGFFTGSKRRRGS